MSNSAGNKFRQAGSAAQDYAAGNISAFAFISAAGFPAFVGYSISRFIRWIFRVLWYWRFSVATITLVLFVMNWNQYVGLIVLVAAIAASFVPQTRDYAPFSRDLERHADERQADLEQAQGNEFLRQCGIVAVDDPVIYLADLVHDDVRGVVEFQLITPIPGKDFGSMSDSIKKNQGVFDAVRTQIEALPGGGIRAKFFQDDPLDEAQTRETPATLSPEKMKVICAVDSDGNDVGIQFGDSSGMVVGGIPGSGKTAGITSFLLPLALSEYVDLSVIDGKGGEDWTAYGPRCSTYVRGDEDLDPIVEFLESFHGEMLERLESQKQALGTSNFWNATPDVRLEAGEKFKLLVIDECQGIFETGGRSKEEKEKLGQILRYCSAVVKRGRSAGFFIIFCTQKPTSESLPTAIRDNAGLRIAFRLTTTAAEQAVLGATPDDANAPRAISIPASRKGGAVLATDTGKLEPVRFYYVPEDVQERLLKEEAK